MTKNRMYRNAKKAWEAGLITTFPQFLDYVPENVLCEDLEIPAKEFAKLLKKPDYLTVTQIAVLGYHTGIPPLTILDIVLRSVDEITIWER